MNINKTYTNSQVKEEMQTYFLENAFISLPDFSNENLIELKKSILKFNLKENYKPLELKMRRVNLKECFDTTILEFIEYFKSVEFLEYVESVTDLELEFDSIQLNVYSHKDFIILSDKQEKKERLNVIFDISDEWDSEFGGILTYTTKEEEVFYVEPSFNSLTILYKPNEVMKYLKYINNLSENKKIIRFELEFKVN